MPYILSGATKSRKGSLQQFFPAQQREDENKAFVYDPVVVLEINRNTPNYSITLLSVLPTHADCQCIFCPDDVVYV